MMRPEIIHYKPKIPNFGDTFNESLPELLDLPPLRKQLLGIGSILTEPFLTQNELMGKSFLTLGSGCRSATPLKVDLCSGAFVRGPLSAKAIDHQAPYISDGAYLMLLSPLYEKIIRQAYKKYEVSIVPYFRSMPFMNLDDLESQGIHVIDPTIPNGIEFALQEIADSKAVIAEAMHGAIFSDILRVPWVKLHFLSTSFEGREVSTFKWTDWLLSIGVNDHVPIETRVHHRIIAKTKNYHLKNRYIRLHQSRDNQKLNAAIKTFLSAPQYYLSTETTIHQMKTALKQKLSEMKEC